MRAGGGIDGTTLVLQRSGRVVHSLNVFERDEAHQELCAVLDGARRGEGTVLVLVGEAGTGKTTLIDVVQSLALAQDVALLRARCSEVETSIPFGMIDRVFQNADLEVPTTRVDSPTDVFVARYTTLMNWLRLREPAPLLVAVDDVQWSDPDSVTLLTALCRRLSDVPVSVVTATRPSPAVALDQMRSLVHDGLAQVEQLRSLSLDASRALLRAHLGTDLPTGWMDQACENCAGNPLLLVEVASAATRGIDLIAYPGALSERIFLPRFAGVGPEALRWARGASIFGSRFHPRLVARMVDQGDAEISSALTELCDSGIVRASTNGDAEFTHPLLRRALYGDLAPPIRQALHARAFELLNDIGAPVAEAAAHAIAANLRGDPAAAATVLLSARAALAVGAVATAAEHFTALTTLAGAATPPTVWLELGQAHLLAGQVERAETAVRRFLAEETLGELERVAGLRVLAQILMALALPDAAMTTFEEASAMARPFDPALAATILLDATFIDCVYEGPYRARCATSQVLQILEEDGIVDENLLRSAQSADSYLSCISGRSDGLGEIATIARRIVAHGDVHELHDAPSWDPVFGYVRLAKIFERFDDELAAFPVLDELTRRQGSSMTHWSYTVNHADTLWRIGRLDEAYAHLQDVMAVAPVLPAIAPYAAVGLAYIAHERGQRDACDAWVATVEYSMDQFGETAYLRLWLLVIECRNALSGGHVDAALHAAARAAEIAAESGILEPCVVPWHGVAIEAHVAGGQLEEAWKIAANLDSLCELLPCHAPRAVAATGRANVEWRRGHVEAAESCYEEAMTHHGAVTMPLAEAETRIAYGRFLRHTGRPARAKVILREALDVLAPTAARRLTAVATNELVAAGGRVSRGRHPTLELTAQEYRVASLAATGLSNKEIASILYVTAKTVDHHLSAVYAKLGINSRRELMLHWRDAAVLGVFARP